MLCRYLTWLLKKKWLHTYRKSREKDLLSQILSLSDKKIGGHFLEVPNFSMNIWWQLLIYQQKFNQVKAQEDEMLLQE